MSLHRQLKRQRGKVDHAELLRHVQKAEAEMAEQRLNRSRWVDGKPLKYPGVHGWMAGGVYGVIFCPEGYE